LEERERMEERKKSQEGTYDTIYIDVEELTQDFVGH
jgi:hypothetical protein